MKKIATVHIYLLIMLAGLFVDLHAQHVYQGRISMPGELIKSGNTLVLNMTIDIANLELYKNQGLTLTPLVVTSSQQAEFPPIMINGKIRNKVYERALVLDDNSRSDYLNYYTIVNKNNRSSQRINYSASIPYEDWMRDAQLDIRERMDGCNGFQSQMVTENIGNRIPYQIEPVPAYIRPEVENVKMRDDRFEAYLEFHVAKTDILPDFRNNRSELDKLERGFSTIRDDKNLTVTDISITGYASPEGSIELNNRLSQGRADALRNYLSSRFSFSSGVYRVDRGGEDWDKLESLVEESSNLSSKEEILSIIRNTTDPTERQSRLTKLNGGTPYKQLLNEYYPKLRRVVCLVNYSVRDFSVDEAKEILNTNPRQLSLDEMYRVANTYTPGSPEYNRTFDIAVRTFPNDPTANLNAAANALSRNDINTAQKYLQSSNTNSAEYWNNMGVLYLKQDDYSRAEDAFTRASQMGSGVASQNLEMVRRGADAPLIEIPY